MNFLTDVNWIGLLVLAIAFLLFGGIYLLSEKVSWTVSIIVAMILGIVLGVAFSSQDNYYLTYTDMLGDIYVNIITALVAPVILVSIISSFISVKNNGSLKRLSFKSVFWLLLSSVFAIILSLIVGVVFKLGSGAGSVFETSISDSTVSAYESLVESFTDVVIGLFPSNIITDLSENNVVAIIIIGVAVAIGYIQTVKEKGEESTHVFRDFILTLKDVIYKILGFIIDLTPYAVLVLLAGSAASFVEDKDALLQLLFLVIAIYAVSIVHTYLVGGATVALGARVNPVRFFKKILPVQITAFTTQSSIGTLPVTIGTLKNKVGVKEEVANFTAPLGTTIGMPGCTCIWPILLAIFYLNATGLNWSFGDYLLLGVLTLVLSIGSAGVLGIALVTAISLFSTLGLPVAAVIAFVPINTISDMVRTLDNVSTAAVATTVVAKQEGLLDYDIFNSDEGADERAYDLNAVQTEDGEREESANVSTDAETKEA
ncbi:MAG: dicarboxylate/amino acid:cation symporter [Clostridia bacterium]|nr:dicarboxylate/amino acid:cation symporter [Clostridia bacterium]